MFINSKAICTVDFEALLPMLSERRFDLILSVKQAKRTPKQIAL